MKKRYKLAVAAAGVAMGFTKVSAPSPAQASVINYNFTVDVTSGKNLGEYYGSFSYDDSTLRREGSEKVSISERLSVLFNYLGTTYTENNDTGYELGFPIVSFDNGKLLGFNYLVDNQFYIGDHLGFPYTGGSKFYQDASDDGQSGTQVGTVSYFQSTPIAEPRTIVGAVAAAGLGLLMKRKQADEGKTSGLSH